MEQPLVLGRYRLVERLAAGGSAEVWRAHDEQLDRQVAVKRLHPHLLPDRPSRKRLVAEARAAAGLSHPVIVEVYDVDAEGDAPVLVMECVDGESLSTRIDNDGPLPAPEAAAVTADVADALYHAHQRGVVHRDVKTGNVLLARDGRTRLVDFGIAHSLAESAERLTITGTVIGTLRAMAPEQLSSGPITPRTDLYGLGVVLHEALTGRPPYPAASPVALAEAQRAGPPSLDGVDPALAALVAACLSYRPEDRPLHAGAVGRALRDWIAGDPSAALAMGPTATHAAVTPPGLAPPPLATAAPARERRGRARAAAVPVLAVGLLLAVGAVLAVIGLNAGALDAEPTQSPVAAATSAAATPTATPAPVVVAAPPVALRGWAAKLAEDYAEQCGEPLDPARIAGMNKKEAEREIEPEIEACEEANEDD